METAIIVASIAALGTLGAAWLSHRQNRTTARVVADVKAQVQNSHETNLRDDIDRVIDMLASVVDGQKRLEEGQKRHDSEIGGLRQDIRLERKERISLAERVR